MAKAKSTSSISSSSSSSDTVASLKKEITALAKRVSELETVCEAMVANKNRT